MKEMSDGDERTAREPATEPGPIGYVDLPPVGSLQAENAVRLEGWALDRSGIVAVTVEREPRAGDLAEHLNDRGLVPVGKATFSVGMRPDVVAAFPDYPELHRSNWSYELRRETISGQTSFRTTVHALAHARDGGWLRLGTRHIEFAAPGQAPPYLFCGRPFDSVFIESNGDVNPYPDCRPERPFGNLLEPGQTLETIWRGREFTELRRQIIAREPPPMCVTCAHFINRNVNDRAYFSGR